MELNNDQLITFILHKLPLVTNIDNLLSIINLMGEIKFNFGEDVEKNYLEGECGYLAIALNEETQWPIYELFFSDPNRYASTHYVVKYGTQYVDITGVWNKETITNVWFNRPENKEKSQIYIDEADPSDYYDNMVCSVSEMKKAREYAKKIVNRLNQKIIAH